MSKFISASTDATRPSPGECVAVFAALVVVALLEISATRNSVLVTHPMWLDECVSSLLLRDSSFRHMVAAIHGGVDTNGPAFYVATWPVVHVLGADTVVALRLVTAAMMLAALTGTYAACRRFVEPGRASIAVLAIAAHPGVVVQTWQVRMYGFWLAAAAWFCAYTVLVTRDASRATRVAGCLLAMVLVTSHWLGVIVLVLVAVPALIVTRAKPAECWNHALPLVAGLATLALSVPLIVSQRRVVGVPTWIEPATLSAVLTQLRWIFVVPSMGVAVAYVAIRLARRSERRVTVAGPPAMLLPVLALLLYPAALVAMSFAMQSVLVERYMLPTVIALALIVGLLALPVRRWIGGIGGAVAAGALVVVTCLELNGLRAVNRQADARAARVIAISERVIGRGERLVFARRFEAYPLLQARPQLAGKVATLDVGTTNEGLSRRTLFERGLARAVTRFYPGYVLVTVDSLRHWGRFTVVTNSDEEDELRRMLPGFRITAVGPDEYRADAP